jgi:CubicO group peptidase (beta-lactamase class C family)
MGAHGPLHGVTASLEAAVATFVKEQHVAGAAAGVVLGDELAWDLGWGCADLATGRRPDARTPHMIASLTKTFTGTAIMQLRDQGLLDLDDPVSRHIPELRPNDAAGLGKVTVRRLLSHESGLMGEPPGADWGTGDYGAIAETLTRVDEIAARIPPNTQCKYSNLGYQLLGEVVARISGMPYVEYVQQRIFDPLGMTSTSFTPDAELASRCAVGYLPATFAGDFRPAPVLRNLTSEAGLWSTAEDLARWIGLQFRTAGGEPDGAQVLRGATLAEMQTARYLSDAAWTEAWCVSWYATRRGESIWIGHAGMLDGFTSYAGFLPAQKLGVIVLVNNGVAEPTDLALRLGEVVAGVARRPPTATLAAPVPDGLRDLPGLYVNERWGMVFRIEIEWRDGALRVSAPDQTSPRRTLAQTGDRDVFTIEGGRDAGETAVFLRAADGRVRAVRLAYSTYARLEPVDDTAGVPAGS